MDAFLVIFIIFIIFFFSYKIIQKIVDADFKQGVVSGELKKDSSKVQLKISEWFVWNIKVNNEKGTAGGSIKINFPIKSALGMGFLCVGVAVLANVSGISLVVSLIFLSFALYHFRIWATNLKSISGIEEFKNVKFLTRNANGKIVAGVCNGINTRYSISLFLVRFGFVFLAFVSGIGIYLYLLLWMILPAIQGNQVLIEENVGSPI